MVSYKDNRFYVKKTTSNKPLFFKVGKAGALHPIVKGGMTVRRGQLLFPNTPQEVFIPRPPDTEGQGPKVNKKNIISEIDKALNSWSISKPKRPITGGFLNLF